MNAESVAERRRQVLVGELPNDFLRIVVVGQGHPNQASPSRHPVRQHMAFIPPNTRGRLSVSILDANLVKNYGLVRMDPYCRLRVGNVVFETQTCVSGSRNPQWNRTIHAYLPNGVESVYLQIYDEKSFTADECIAFSHIIIPAGVFHGETIDEYFTLSGQQGEGKEGMVHLVFAFVPLEGGDIPIATPLPPVVITEEDTKELQEMFPSVDKDVIKCILTDSRGNKDAAVSALLELTSTQ